METQTVLLMLFLPSFLCLCLLLFLHKVWWTPIRIQKFMGSQGIKGPPYRILHGSTKEVVSMKRESIRSPMELTSHHLFPRIQPQIYSWTKLYGINYLNWYGPRAQLIVTEPELIKEILNNKDGAYSRTIIQDNLNRLLGEGLLTAEGDKWSRLRKLSNHAFHAESLKDLIPTIISSVKTTLEKWKIHERKEIEAYEEFKHLTSEVISRTGFGSSYLEGKKIFDMLMKIGFITTRNDHKIRFPGIGDLVKTKDDIESEKLILGIQESIREMIQNREAEVLNKAADSFGSDFLGQLVKAYHDPDPNQRISIEEVIDECTTFYLSGQETTASLLTWTILLLAIHTDWQEKARAEVLELFGQQNPNPDCIARLKTMTMIFNESLRLYPPALTINRKVEREVRLGKFMLPAGIYLLIPILALHHNPQFWGEDVHLFRPERFAEGVAKATNNNAAAFLPFGAGPRTCVGLNFAAAEVRIVLSMILQRYKFTLSPNYVHSPVQILSICPQHGLQVMLQAL